MVCVLERIRQLADDAPDASALRDANRVWSRRELQVRIRDVVDVFVAKGLKRVGLVGDNQLEWVLADLACWAAGTLNVPVPGFFSAEQKQHLERSAGLDALVGVPDAFAAGQQASLIPLAHDLVMLPLTPQSVPVAVADDVRKVTFTSGSSGTPKGVCLTSDHLNRTSAALADAFAGQALTEHLCVLPLATLLENVAGVYVPLIMGACVSVLPLSELGFRGASHFDVASFMRALHRQLPDSLILVPQLLNALVVAGEMGLPLPSTLRVIAVGGAKVSPALLARAAALGLPVFEGYGLSECGSVVTLNTPQAHRPGSTGKPLGHVELRLSEQGEVLVRGAVMAGYLGEATRPGEWLATGDLGHFDDDGFLYLQGRCKNLFITAFGRNVHPEWLESELSAALPIQQVAAFGEAMATPVAIVVARDGFSPATVSKAIAVINARLPDYARIERFLLSPTPFSQANGLATANGRVIRAAVEHHFGEALAACRDADQRGETAPHWHLTETIR